MSKGETNKMRVNIYAEEMTDKIEIIEKEVDGNKFIALRFYLELPVVVKGKQYKGPFMHRPGDDDSSAVTFWGKQDLRKVLRKALKLLDRHYEAREKKGRRGNKGWMGSSVLVKVYRNNKERC